MLLLLLFYLSGLISTAKKMSKHCNDGANVINYELGQSSGFKEM